jgi:hypothetical protein
VERSGILLVNTKDAEEDHYWAFKHTSAKWMVEQGYTE